MKFIRFIFLLILTKEVAFADDSTGLANIRLSKDFRGLGEMSWMYNGNYRNYIDSGFVLGVLHMKYKISDSLYNTGTQDQTPIVLKNQSNSIRLLFHLPNGLDVLQQFNRIDNAIITWSIDLVNRNNNPVDVLDVSFLLPIGKFNRYLPIQENVNQHTLVNGNASFCYWIPYSGSGNVLLMTMLDRTSLEYLSRTKDESVDLYTKSAAAVDRTSDTWRLPSTSSKLLTGEKLHSAFKFQMVSSLQNIRNALYDNGCLDVKIAPGMTIPNNLPLLCLLRSREPVKKLIPEYPTDTKIEYIGKRGEGYSLYKILFSKTGENLVTVQYGAGQRAFLNFFATEPLETLIKKRARFITTKQQIKDTSKWYNGLYSIWDMQREDLLSPEHKGPLPDFVVGGSDDPSNSKPVYVSEKNVVYPDSSEIASLEYYEKNFVWGGLQRRDDEYPYPYGIYGSENWFENRSGKIAGYNSGGWGKERMWRTFDYTTHIAIYLNLYKIAKNNPEFVHYLDAAGYLERAYRTAMAFFLVPYNIQMGEKWSFHGWTDWAYKQGNFHERYIIELVDELNKNGENEKADILRREWEKKVKYFIYDDPWPFGSEFEIDRTAFESSFYIAKYAKDNKLKPQEQLWYDKNKKIWYSHLYISDSATNVFMKKQLNANLALRGTIEPAFNLLGSAWVSSYGLDYMSQMGGVAILDYAINFSDDPAKYINIGYNSLLSSWALMNTGNEKSGFGYWYPGKKNDGAVGWVYTPWQHSVTYFANIPAKRGIWQYDGEIDHGLVGAIHGASSIVVDDPLFGLTGYGCKVVEGKDRIFLTPEDGVRQRVHIFLHKRKISLTLFEDGFARDSLISLSSNFDYLNFFLENRQMFVHNSFLSIQNLGKGEYEVFKNKKMLTKFIKDTDENLNIISIPVEKDIEEISIIRK